MCMVDGEEGDSIDFEQSLESDLPEEFRGAEPGGEASDGLVRAAARFEPGEGTGIYLLDQYVPEEDGELSELPEDGVSDFNPFDDVQEEDGSLEWQQDNTTGYADLDPLDRQLLGVVSAEPLKEEPVLDAGDSEGAGEDELELSEFGGEGTSNSEPSGDEELFYEGTVDDPDAAVVHSGAVVFGPSDEILTEPITIEGWREEATKLRKEEQEARASLMEVQADAEEAKTRSYLSTDDPDAAALHPDVVAFGPSDETLTEPITIEWWREEATKLRKEGQEARASLMEAQADAEEARTRSYLSARGRSYEDELDEEKRAAQIALETREAGVQTQGSTAPIIEALARQEEPVKEKFLSIGTPLDFSRDYSRAPKEVTSEDLELLAMAAASVQPVDFSFIASRARADALFRGGLETVVAVGAGVAAFFAAPALLGAVALVSGAMAVAEFNSARKIGQGRPQSVGGRESSAAPSESPRQAPAPRVVYAQRVASVLLVGSLATLSSHGGGPRGIDDPLVSGAATLVGADSSGIAAVGHASTVPNSELLEEALKQVTPVSNPESINWSAEAERFYERLQTSWTDPAAHAVWYALQEPGVTVEGLTAQIRDFMEPSSSLPGSASGAVVPYAVTTSSSTASTAFAARPAMAAR